MIMVSYYTIGSPCHPPRRFLERRFLDRRFLVLPVGTNIHTNLPNRDFPFLLVRRRLLRNFFFPPIRERERVRDGIITYIHIKN